MTDLAIRPYAAADREPVRAIFNHVPRYRRSGRS
jgi:hypothetical protein